MEDTEGKIMPGTSISVFVLASTLFLGGVILVIGYIVSRLSRANKSSDSTKNVTESEKVKFQDPRDSARSASGTAGNKRAKNKKRRETQQEFTHSWMVGALKGHTASVLDMNFSSNGKFLASCAEDRTVLLWCTKELTVKEKRSLRINIEFDHATLIRWSPDGKAFIIHKAVANTIEVYKISKKPDGTLASATKALEFPKQHTEDVVGMDIAFTGKYIITCSKANDLILWDLKGQVLATVELHLGSTYRARISPCGRFVGTSGFVPDLNVWEVVFSKSGEFTQVAKAFDLGGHTSGILDFTFSADSSQMATISKDGTFRLYNTNVEFKKGEDPRILQIGLWENAATANIALSPNTEVLAIAHGSSLSFYSTITGLLDNTIEDIFQGPIMCLAFDAVGEYILVAGDRHIKVFRNVTGYRVAIESAKRKLTQRQTSATKERLEKLIEDNKKFLQAMGEKCP
ncbi:transducin beta-like protein 2 isoform X4 [Megachile rotundata]|uniref:transducin beta-like protein 2 isoform X4 n=1 Tax=Megachile rotundata TaxID=143995 RepID=UPI0006150C0F|nr:PREDICTED: transducin beta-like protein 2 isoform X4 [Megachile rotundata]